MSVSGRECTFLGCDPHARYIEGLVGFVFVTDHPFLGETAVNTDDYARTLRHMDARPNL